MPIWMGRGGEWRREIAVAIALGLFLGVIGPFGSFLNGDLAHRMSYWAAMTIVGMALYGLGLRCALHQGRRLGQPDWFVVPIAVAVLAVPMSAIVAFSAAALWPGLTHRVRPFDWYAQVLVISLPISVLVLWIRRSHSGLAGPAKPRPETGDGLSQPELPPVLSRQRLICLQMEDHYVRIHTQGGSELVLSTFKDAIDSARPLDGLQVHRSWWVARDAVVRPIRSGRKVELQLTNGIRAPVSRASVAKLRAIGWLDAENGESSTA